MKFCLRIFPVFILYSGFLETDSYVNSVADGASAADQMPAWKQARLNRPPFTATDQLGRPYPSLTGSLKVGPNGPILMSDTNLIQIIQSLSRERIPERWAHAKGTGALGYFDVTTDFLSKYTKAKVFTSGKRTPVLVRFSRVLGEKGSPDTAIEHRGFAIKFYTEEGNYDMACLNTPVFPISDPIFVGSIVRAARKNPRTGLFDNTMFWDFCSLREETIHFTTQLHARIAFDSSYRFMKGFSINAFKLVNHEGKVHIVKFHLKPLQTGPELTLEDIFIKAGIAPDGFNEDLYDHIAAGNYPQWDLFAQIMTEEEADNYRFNVFDATKETYEEDFPLHLVGRLTLNQNPSNMFRDVEQAAFCPSNLVPGIEFSKDPLLIGRGLSYVDTHRHRLGPNFMHLPPNRPRIPVHTYDRDGQCFMGDPEGEYDGPPYFPNSFGGPTVDEARGGESSYFLSGLVSRHDTMNEEDHYTQPRIFLQSLNSTERMRLVSTLGLSIGTVTDQTVTERAIGNFGKISPELGEQVAQAVALFRSQRQAQAEAAR